MTHVLYSTGNTDDEIPEYFKERRYVDIEKIKDTNHRLTGKKN